MIAAIVGRGEGRERATEFPADVRIGVNHVAQEIPVGWWCFADVEAWQQVRPLGNPRWFVDDNAAFRIRRRGGVVPPDAVLWSSVRLPSGRERWRVWSVTAALVLAASLGARVVRCHGVAACRPPVDGEPDRFRVEREIWSEVLRELPEVSIWGCSTR